jgi:NADH-quinone oxidoreductase subunit L
MPDLIWIVVLIPAFPLLGFVLNALFIRRERLAGLVASAAVVLSFITALVAIYVLQSLQPATTAEGAAEAAQRIDFVLWDWISIGAFRVPFGLLFDQLTAVMTLLITGVGGIIHIYSIGYIHGDPRPVRFFAYMNLFVAAMLFLVMGDNMLLLFLGWEGVGLCSFLLIGHWFDRRWVPEDAAENDRIVPSAAAVKAFVVNRVGDAGMLLAMMAIFIKFGSLNFFTVDPQQNGQIISGFLEKVGTTPLNPVDLGPLGTITVIGGITFLLLVGVTGKSAQIPLFVWLPDAMAGPTPVSALIHAATMVTSGVYLIVRNHTLFSASTPAVQGLILTVGWLTALLAATAAISQWDIKRVLAYSTISQLGYMIAAVGVGAYVAGMFHLLTHGIFKALLFLGSGSIIHGTGTQDMRKMGGLRDKMRTSFWTYMIGALALAGIVPLSGFWSKDEIIGQVWNSSKGSAVALMIASAFTAFYMGRQVALVFWGKPRAPNAEHPHESGPLMLWPLIVLAIGAVIGGAINLPWFPFLKDFLNPVLEPPGAPPETAESFSIWIALFTTVLAVGSGLLGWWLYARLLANRIRVGREDPGDYYLGDVWRGSRLGWGFDWFYNSVVARAYQATARFLSDVVDQQAIDGILVDGVGRSFGWLAQWFRRAETGYVRNYALVFLAGVIGLIGYFVFMR